MSADFQGCEEIDWEVAGRLRRIDLPMWMKGGILVEGMMRRSGRLYDLAKRFELFWSD